MHPASRNPSSLSTLLLLLFLLSCSGLRTAKGLPLNTGNANVTICNATIREIRKQLEESKPLPLNSADGEDRWLLQNASRRLNLCEFLKAAETLTDKQKIKTSLKCLMQCLPRVEPTVTDSRIIFIKEGNWNDFRKKLQYYLHILGEELDSALNPRIPYPTSGSVPRSSQNGTLEC
ncbi:interleukin-3 [Sciurus carolinensis]|uniref:interleukin-3 n=1 Tax=Sciurus carolinensis TaxID=30640 RepID=UPI001FB3E04F|nr:interleukin-3 [Sciurus carolinensis]